MAQKFVTPVTIRNLASASSDGLAVSVDGDTNDRIKFEAGGRVVWGSGASAGDVNLYRSDVGALKTDHTFEAESGIITLTTTGAPVANIADGALAVDTTNDDLYFRSNGAWKKVDNVAAVSDTAPSNPQEGDIWFESDTGDFFVYYSGAWIDVGGSSVANIAVTTTPPASPVNGDLWFDTDTAKTYVYYNDGTSGQWVEIGAASAAAAGTDGAIQFSTGGAFDSSANLVWDDANNRLGIGTTTPSADLEVNIGSLGSTAGDSVVAQRWYSTVTNASFLDFRKVRWSSGVDWNSAGWKIQHTVDSSPMAFISFSPDDAPRGLDFGTNNATRMTIDQNGNVGIGTADPLANLDVRGGLLVHGSTGSYSGDEVGALTINNNSVDGVVDFTQGLVFTDNTNGAGPWTHAGIVATGSSGYRGSLVFGTDDDGVNNTTGIVERMRILPNGNVGIGTTSPPARLQVASQNRAVSIIDSGINNYAELAYTNLSGDGPAYGLLTGYSVVLQTGTTRAGLASRLTVDVNGNVNINTGVIVSNGTYSNTTASGANMYVSSGGYFYRSTSSAKYKTDIETLDDDHADIVFDLRPVWYRSTTESDPEEWSYYGLIAEEVAEVDPRLVSFGASADCSCPKDDDGNLIGDHDVSCLTEPEGVQYDRLVPHLISLAQRQNATIQELTARIEALEAV